MKDLKESLTSARKPDITHVRSGLMTYTSRAGEWGSVKYERGNYLRPLETPAADFNRMRSYLRAVVSHVQATLDSMEMHQATDPSLQDVDGMRLACYAADTDITPGSELGASKLPHLCGASASIMMALQQAINAGLLPADPGRPWEGEKAQESAALVALNASGDLSQPVALAAALAADPAIENVLFSHSDQRWHAKRDGEWGLL